MIIEFSTENFRSLKSRANLSLLASGQKSLNPMLDTTNVFHVPNREIRLLKAAVIYGANGSGKSNVVSAIRFMTNFVLNSSKESQADDPISVEAFRLDSHSRVRPSLFEMLFIANKRVFRYGFEVNQERVVREWLFHVPAKRERVLFSRNESEITLSSRFLEGKGLEARTRKNALFLSVCSQFNGKIAGEIVTWFKSLSIISGLQDVLQRAQTIHLLGESDSKRGIESLLKNWDLGFTELSTQDVPIEFPSNLPSDMQQLVTNLKKFAGKDLKRAQLLSRHAKFNDEMQVVGHEEFDVDSNESEGTKKLVSMAGPIWRAISNSQILIWDEFDARVHPLINRAILGMFNSKDANPNNAQLICVTHDTNLLSRELIRRDQVWFCEKDRMGDTHLSSLAEYKVRNDASFESDYFGGKYGAIPFLGGIKLILDRRKDGSSRGE